MGQSHSQHQTSLRQLGNAHGKSRPPGTNGQAPSTNHHRPPRPPPINDPIPSFSSNSSARPRQPIGDQGQVAPPPQTRRHQSTSTHTYSWSSSSTSSSSAAASTFQGSQSRQSDASNRRSSSLDSDWNAQISRALEISLEAGTYNADCLTRDHGGECTICFDDLVAGDTIARLPCLCIYHKACIDDWFRHRTVCPSHPDELTTLGHLPSNS